MSYQIPSIKFNRLKLFTPWVREKVAPALRGVAPADDAAGGGGAAPRSSPFY